MDFDFMPMGGPDYSEMCAIKKDIAWREDFETDSGWPALFLLIMLLSGWAAVVIAILEFTSWGLGWWIPMPLFATAVVSAVMYFKIHDRKLRAKQNTHKG